jgi:hypothetical protein
MRGVPPVTLPEAAQSKLLALQLARGAAEDAARAATTRLQQLPRDADERMRDALASERDKQQHRYGQLSQLLSRVQQQLSELRSGTGLQLAEPVELTLKPGEKLADAIEATRTEVKMTRDRLAAVQAARLPVAEYEGVRGALHRAEHERRSPNHQLRERCNQGHATRRHVFGAGRVEFDLLGGPQRSISRPCARIRAPSAAPGQFNCHRTSAAGE